MKRALISVSDKTDIVWLGEQLAALDYEIISTGGTAKVLTENGLKVTPVEEMTGVPEMLDGRVKTLSPKIFGGILARRDDPTHLQQLADQGMATIDLICVNLYPFEATANQDNVRDLGVIEQIDIGGPSLLRAAAKNFRDVIVLNQPADYVSVIEALKKGDLSLADRRQLAAKVFSHTAHYDAVIADYLTSEAVGAPKTLAYFKQQTLRYGENPQQHATFYRTPQASAYSIAGATQLHGKALSYNNIRDADAALRVIRDFEGPTVVALKHMNPCGVGTAATLEAAWNRCYAADDVSIFGGIIALNRPVDLATATKMHGLFLEMIIAPSYDDEALNVLAQKKNLRLMTVDFQAPMTNDPEAVSVLGGLLLQDRDVATPRVADFEVVSAMTPTDAQMDALVFAMTVVKHVKSNAIVVATGDQTLGVGPGQMNRIDATKIAVDKAAEKGDLAQAVLASDAFFPMDDCVAYAAAHGIKAIVEPGGSIKDQASIDMANQYGIALVFSHARHFRH